MSTLIASHGNHLALAVLFVAAIGVGATVAAIGLVAAVAAAADALRAWRPRWPA